MESWYDHSMGSSTWFWILSRLNIHLYLPSLSISLLKLFATKITFRFSQISALCSDCHNWMISFVLNIVLECSWRLSPRRIHESVHRSAMHWPSYWTCPRIARKSMTDEWWFSWRVIFSRTMPNWIDPWPKLSTICLWCRRIVFFCRTWTSPR